MLNLSAYTAKMPFSQVPQESKNQINKAGKSLANYGDFNHKEIEWAWDLTSRWRACHAYPINTFQSTLRTKIRRHGSNPIVAQRLKRMPTIIDKLRRYSAMQLTTMQDIAGIRAILSTVTQAEKLTEEYLNSSFSHELISQKNYIESPRNEDGYRSIHLIYQYTNKRNPHYDGLRLELQIRSRLQHIWATAVETMGTFLGQALKSRQGDKAWLYFFAITSSAFAHTEHRSPLPRFHNLSRKQTFREVAVAERSLKALEMMNGFSVVAQNIRPGRGYSYHLIILDSLKKNITVVPYDRDSFKQAVSDYSEYEEKAAKGQKIEPVLVSAGRLDQLQRAYPNFFLDIREFGHMVRKIVVNQRT